MANSMKTYLWFQILRSALLSTWLTTPFPAPPRMDVILWLSPPPPPMAVGHFFKCSVVSNLDVKNVSKNCLDSFFLRAVFSSKLIFKKCNSERGTCFLLIKVKWVWRKSSILCKLKKCTCLNDKLLPKKLNRNNRAKFCFKNRFSFYLLGTFCH